MAGAACGESGKRCGGGEVRKGVAAVGRSYSPLLYPAPSRSVDWRHPHSVRHKEREVCWEACRSAKHLKHPQGGSETAPLPLIIDSRACASSILRHFESSSQSRKVGWIDIMRCFCRMSASICCPLSYTRCHTFNPLCLPSQNFRSQARAELFSHCLLHNVSTYLRVWVGAYGHCPTNLITITPSQGKDSRTGLLQHISCEILV